MQRDIARYSSAWLLAGFVCALIGVRWMLIHAYGNPTPFWDQWDGEAARLYQPYVSGALGWRDLLSAHNEHRILTTRLFALGLFIINGQWNPLLQMLMNAVIHAMVIAYLFQLLSDAAPRLLAWPTLLLGLLLFAVPYAWENTLSGFQTQFYFNLLFCFIALRLLVCCPVLSRGWWGGLGFTVVAFLSLASGIFSAAAAVVVLLVRCTVANAPVRRLLLGCALLAAAFLAGDWLTPTVQGHAVLKAKSIMEFADALIDALSWPLKGHWKRALLLYMPALIYTWVLVRHRRVQARESEWFLLALLVWVGGQAVTLAYGRATFVLSSRYLDLLVIGVVANLACLLWLYDRYAVDSRRRIAWAAIIALWVGGVAFGFAHYQERRIVGELEYKKAMGAAEQANVRGFLATGDPSYMVGKPALEIPYPNADRLMQLLSDPGIRRILPAADVPKNLPEHRAGRLDSATDWLLSHGYLMIIIAVICVGMAFAVRIASPPRHAFTQLEEESSR